MSKIKLNDCGVIFSEEPRGYLLSGLMLSGISHLARKHINDPYKDAPEHIMNLRAKDGNNLHSAITVYWESGIESDSQELKNYIELTKSYEHLANEYTVTDFSHFATRIDDVFFRDGQISISNTKRVKSTSHEIIEAWRWQGSIEAHLFELVNPHLKVDRMIAIQVVGDIANEIELERIDIEEVKKLLECDVEGLPYIDESKLIKKDTNTALSQLLELEEIIATHKAEIDRVTKDAEVLKEFLKAEMLKSEVKKWETDRIIVTYVAPQEREGLDSKKVKEYYPEVFEECKKNTFVKDNLRITIKK